MNNLLTWLKDTMLIERFSGVALYVAVTALAYLSLKNAKSDRKVHSILRMTLIALSVMAFFYIPTKHADLFRLREIMSLWENTSFSEFFDTYLRHASTPASYLLMYLAEKTQIEGVLPAAVCAMFFTAVFSILRTEYKENEASSFAVSHVFLFFMASGGFLEVISGIRCFLSLSIVAWCVYKETACDRAFAKDILLYIIACTLHLAAIPVVGLRIAYLFVCDIKGRGIRIGNMIMALAFCTVALVFGKDYLLAATEKGSTYITQEIYGYTWEYLIGGICLAVIILTLVKYGKIRNNKKYSRLKSLSVFCALMATVEVCFCFEYSIFHRFVMFNTIIALPVISAVIDSEREKKQALYINSLRLLTYMIFAIACTRGNLCGYKFFIL